MVPTGTTLRGQAFIPLHETSPVGCPRPHLRGSHAISDTVPHVALYMPPGAPSRKGAIIAAMGIEPEHSLSNASHGDSTTYAF